MNEAYERMLNECARLGVIPLTREQFEAEDQRIYAEMVRRKRGDFSGFNPPPLNFGVYR